MNRAKDLEEKQAITRWLIQEKLHMLNSGYNPITKTMEVTKHFVNERTPFMQALEIAKDIEDLGGVKIKNVAAKAGGTYSTKIKWGIHNIDARPYGNKGYWGKRIKQINPRERLMN